MFPTGAELAEQAQKAANGNKAVYDEGGAANSVQGRFRQGQSTAPFSPAGMMGIISIAQLADNGVTAWSYYPGKRDKQLRVLANSEPILSGACYVPHSRIKSLDWEINGDPPQKKKKFQDVVANADGGAGWGEFVGKVVNDLVMQDNGAFIELTGREKNPARPLVKKDITGLFYLDSAQCIRTYDKNFPVAYNDPTTGDWRKLHYSRVIQLSNFPQGHELARGVGYCPVSRVLSATQFIKSVQEFRTAKVTGNFKKAILLLTGMTPIQANVALNQSEAIKQLGDNLEESGVFFYNGIPVFANTDPELKGMLLDLASLPDGFDVERDFFLYVCIVALTFGVDVRELWPASQTGATKGDATVQNMKMRGKLLGDIIQTIERAINWWVLPNELTFTLDFVDDEQDLLTTQVKQAKSSMIQAWAIGGIINQNQALKWGVIEGIIPPEIVPQDDPEDIPLDAPASDTSETAGENDGDPDAKTEDADADEDGKEGGQKSAVPFPVTATLPPVRTVTSYKDLASTRLYFTDAFTDIGALANAGELDKRNFSARLRSVLKIAGNLAYLDGLEDGGIASAELSPEDTAAINAWYSEQSGYVTDLAGEVFTDEGLDTDTLIDRAEMWANKAIQSIYYAGLASANANGLYVWELGPTEHCEDCKRLAGQKHRMKHWEAAGWLPQCDKLDCGGFKCECKLTPTTGKAEGRF